MTTVDPQILQAVADCPICGPVAEAIKEAMDAHQLRHLYEVKIPHLKGITEEQRDALKVLVERRFSTLNGAALPPPKPRWGR